MPFTLSHPAAVIGLRRSPLPMPALVIGSMVPDLPVVAPITPWRYAFSHSVPGLLTVDLATTLALTVLWVLVIREPAAELAPGPVRDRLAAAPRYRVRTWALCVPAAIIGTATHLLWDDFTHARRWGTDHVGFLQHRYAGHFGYSWAQLVSGVAGLAIVIAVVGRDLVRRRPVPRPVRLSWFSAWALPAIAGSTVLAAAFPALDTLADAVHSSPDAPLHKAAFAGASWLVAALGTGLLIAAMVWQVAVRQTAGAPADTRRGVGAPS